MTKRLPLEGIRVVDFSWALAGPVTTKFMALYGAEVVKIETRTRLDGARLANPFFEGKPGVNRSAYFANNNSNKLSLRLDLSKPEARDIARRLVAVADVVAESFSMGVLNRWGLDYPELAKTRPDIIMISLTMQGQTGRYAPHLGFGRTLSGLVGIDHLTGFPNSNPSGPNQPYTDLVVPWFAVSSLITALERRNATGQGTYIDLSQLEAAMHFLAPAVLDFEVNHHDQVRQGNRVSYAAPHGVYRCKGDIPQGRWCAIAVETDAQWKALCGAMGMPRLAEDARFSTLLARKRHEDELDRTIEVWTSGQEAKDAAALLKKAGVPAAEVATGKVLFEDEHLKACGFFRKFEHPTIGQHWYNSPSFHFSDLQLDHRRGPTLGEHDEYIFCEVLGMDKSESKRLRETGTAA